MGSRSSNRNETDKASLRSLRGREGGASASIAEEPPTSVCLPSFFVDLDQLPILKVGVVLSLDDDGQISALGKTVGKLSGQRLMMVRRCREEGIGYRGAVKQHKKNGKIDFYGDFRKYKR